MSPPILLILTRPGQVAGQGFVRLSGLRDEGQEYRGVTSPVSVSLSQDLRAQRNVAAHDRVAGVATLDAQWTTDSRPSRSSILKFLSSTTQDID